MSTLLGGWKKNAHATLSARPRDVHAGGWKKNAHATLSAGPRDVQGPSAEASAHRSSARERDPLGEGFHPRRRWLMIPPSIMR